MTHGTREATAAGTTGAAPPRPGKRAGELLALELPHGDRRARPARSPAAWLHGLDRDGPPLSPQTRRLAEDYAGRAVRRGGRWVVMLGDHTARRAFRRLHAVDLAVTACTPARALLTRGEAEALIADGVAPAELQPLFDRSADCSTLGAVRMREALEHLTSLDYAAVHVHAGRAAAAGRAVVSGVIAIPNTWA